MLAKAFYDKTGGKKLIVTSGNDGKHADGEHSHKKGWKVDINDWDGESDGYIVNADGTKGSLADWLIDYGHKLGLGMNWEGDHIDVSLDGHQWADPNGNPLDTPQNFGGFNSQGGTPSTEQGNTYDPNFTDRQNEIWQMAQYASKRLRDEYQIRLAPELIYRQWVLEDGGDFTHPTRNWGGLKDTAGNFRSFGSDKEYADAYVDDFMRLRPEINDVTDENGMASDEAFTQVMLDTGYITQGDYDNYIKGLPNISAPKSGYANRKGGATTPETSTDENSDDAFYQRLIADILSEDNKPQFISTGEDDFTKNILSAFAAEKRDEASGSELLDLDSMFDGEGNFINSKSNRRKLTELYGDDLAEFGQTQLDERLSELAGKNQPLANLSVDDRKLLSGVLKSKLEDAGVKVAGNFLQHLNEGDAKTFNKALAGLHDAQEKMSTNGLPEELQTEISRLRDEIKTLSDSLIQASTKAEFAETDKQIKARNAKINSIRTLGKDIAKLENDLQTASENLIKANATGNTDKIVKASDKVSTLQSQLDKKQSELQKILSPQVQDATPKTVPPANQQTADFMANLNAEIQTLKSQLTPELSREQVQPLTQQIQDKTAQLDKINKLNAQIDTLTTQAAEAYQNLQNPEKQSDAIKQLSDATKKIQAAETELAKIISPQVQDATPEPSKKFAPVKAKADEKISTLNQQIDALRLQDETANAAEIERLTDSRYAIQAVTDELAQLDAQFQPLIQARNEADKNHDAKAYNAAKRKVDALSKQYKQKSKELDKLLNPQETSQPQETFAPVNDEVANELASIARQKSELDAQGRQQNAKQITELNRRRDKIQAGNNELAKLQSQAEAKEAELSQTTDVAKQNALKDQLASLYSKIDGKTTALSNFINPPQKVRETFEPSANVQARIDAVNARIRELRNSGEEKNSAEIANLSRQRDAVQSASNELEKLKSQRTTAERDGNSQVANQLTGKIANLNNKLNAATQKLDKILNPPQVQERPQQPAKPVNRQTAQTISRLNSDIEWLDSQLTPDLSDEQYSAVKSQLDGKRARLEQIKSLNEQIAAAQKQKDKIRTDAKKARESNDEVANADLRRQFGSVSERQRQAQAELDNLVSEPVSDEVAEAVAKLNAEIRELENLIAKSNSRDEKKSLLKKLAAKKNLLKRILDANQDVVAAWESLEISNRLGIDDVENLVAYEQAQAKLDKLLNPQETSQPQETFAPVNDEVANELASIAWQKSELDAQGRQQNAKQITELNRRRDKIQAGNNELAKLQSQAEAKEAELSQTTDVAKQNALKDQLASLYSKIDGKTTALSNFINPPQKVRETFEPSANVQARIDAVNARIRELRNSGEEKNSAEIANLSRQRDAVQSASNELEKLKSQRTTAERDGNSQVANQLTGKIANLNNKLNAATQKLDKILNPPQVQERPQQPAKPVNRQTAQTISRLNSDIEWLDSQLTPDLSDEQYSAVKSQLDGKRARLEQIKSLNEQIAAAQKQKDKIRTDAKKARESNDEVTNADLRRQFGSVSERQQQAQAELDNLVSEPVSDEVAEAVAKLNAEIRELENQIAKSNSRDEKKSLLKKLAAKKNLLKRILDANQDVVAARESLEISNRLGIDDVENLVAYEQAQAKLDKLIHSPATKETTKSPKKSAEPAPKVETQSQPVNESETQDDDMQKTFRDAANRPLKALDDCDYMDVLNVATVGGRRFESANSNLAINFSNQHRGAVIISYVIDNGVQNRPLSEDALTPLKAEFDQLGVSHSNVGVYEDYTEITVIMSSPKSELDAIPTGLDRNEKRTRRAEIQNRYLQKAKAVSKGLLAIFDAKAFDGQFKKEVFDEAAALSKRLDAKGLNSQDEVESQEATSFVNVIQRPAQQNKTQPAPQPETTPTAESSPQRTQPPQPETQPVETAETENAEEEFTTDDGSIFGSVEAARRDMLESLKELGIEPLDKKSQSKKTATAEEDTRRPKLVNFVDDSDEALEAAIAEWNKEVNKISSMPMFNPKLWQAGLKIGAIYVQRGINKFADWASKMTESLGKKSEPWQAAIWETINALPEGSKFDEKQITNIAKYIGALMEKGDTATFEDVTKQIEQDIGKEATEKISPMIEASYKGIQKFFADRQQETKSKPQTEEKASETKSPTEAMIENLDQPTQDLIEQRAREALKATELEGKTAPVKYEVGIVKVFQEEEYNVSIATSVEEDEENMMDVTKNVNAIAIKLNGKIAFNFNTYSVYTFKNVVDAAACRKALNIYFEKKKKSEATEEKPPESKKAANKGEQDTSTAELAQGYKTESGLTVPNENRAVTLFDLSKVQLPPNPSEKFQTAYRGIQETLNTYESGGVDLLEVKTKVNSLVDKAKFALDEEQTDARNQEINILNGINTEIQNKNFTPEQQKINDNAKLAFFMLQRAFTRLHDTGKVPDDEYQDTRKQINQLDHEMTSGKKSALTAFRQLREILSDVTDNDVEDYLSTANPAKESRLWKIWSGDFEAAMDAFNNGVDLINFDALDAGIKSGAWEKLIASLPKDTVNRLLSEDKKRERSSKKVQSELETAQGVENQSAIVEDAQKKIADLIEKAPSFVPKRIARRVAEMLSKGAISPDEAVDVANKSLSVDETERKQAEEIYERIGREKMRDKGAETRAIQRLNEIADKFPAMKDSVEREINAIERGDYWERNLSDYIGDGVEKLFEMTGDEIERTASRSLFAKWQCQWNCVKRNLAVEVVK